MTVTHKIMTDQKPTVVLLGALDTKGQEFAYIKELLETRGLRTLTVDTSIVGEPAYAPDISASDVLATAGEDLESLRMAGDQGKAVNSMAVGVVRAVKSLHRQGRLNGILSMGGVSGTTIGTAAMRNLPLGVPKVMVSTLVVDNVSDFVGAKDITLIYPVVELEGLNRATRLILAKAAGAVAGMVEMRAQMSPETMPSAALTTMSATSDAADNIRMRMENGGFEVISFSASGRGGDVMEELIRDHIFDVVIDLTTSELVDVLCGGGYPSSGDRLTAAGRLGIPQVVVPGGIDMLCFGPQNRVPARFSDRNIYIYNDRATMVRTDEDEARIVAGAMARRLNDALGPVRLLWPARGVSALDEEGMPFFDPDVDGVFIEVLRNRLDEAEQRLIEVDAHINDDVFADAVCQTAFELYKFSLNEPKP